jgi:hypothetical protein
MKKLMVLLMFLLVVVLIASVAIAFRAWRDGYGHFAIICNGADQSMSNVVLTLGYEDRTEIMTITDIHSRNATRVNIPTARLVFWNLSFRLRGDSFDTRLNGAPEDSDGLLHVGADGGVEEYYWTQVEM